MRWDLEENECVKSRLQQYEWISVSKSIIIQHV